MRRRRLVSSYICTFLPLELGDLLFVRDCVKSGLSLRYRYELSRLSMHIYTRLYYALWLLLEAIVATREVASGIASQVKQKNDCLSSWESWASAHEQSRELKVVRAKAETNSIKVCHWKKKAITCSSRQALFTA